MSTVLTRIQCKGFWLEISVSIVYFLVFSLVLPSPFAFFGFLSPIITNATWILIHIITPIPPGHIPQTKLANTLCIPGTWGAISLGSLIIADNRLLYFLPHELGHSKQALLLGPFYWFIIGIPSLLHAGIWLAWGQRWNYLDFFTEAWAEKWKVNK